MAMSNDWCRYEQGRSTVYSRFHEYRMHKTFWRGAESYRCICGSRLTPDEYAAYKKQEEVLQKVLRSNIRQFLNTL